MTETYPTAKDIVVDALMNSKSQREAFLACANDEDGYAKGVAMSNAVTYAFRQFGRGEGDVNIAHTEEGKIIAYGVGDKAVPTKSCTVRGRYNVTQARDAKFILGIASTLPYAEVLRALKVSAVDIPSKLREYIKDNHEYHAGSKGGLPRTFTRDWDNFLLTVTKHTKDEMLPETSLAYENCRAVTAVILRAAVREEEDGKKKVIKQSELTEAIVAGAEEFVFRIAKDELKQQAVVDRLMGRI